MHEVSVEICSILKADATLVALLSSDAAIVYGLDLPHDLQSRVPLVRVWLVAAAPRVNASRLGVHDLRYQIDAVSNSEAVSASIIDRIDAVLSVPWNRGRIESANYRVDKCVRTLSRPIKMQVDIAGGGKKLQCLSADWSLTAIRTN